MLLQLKSSMDSNFRHFVCKFPKWLRYFKTIFFLPFLLVSILQTHALTNNLALTPPMGWNNYNAFGCSGLNESLITNTAALMVANGMAAAGYKYVDIDDGWAAARDANGIIQAYSIPGKFPHGIRWLADQVHALGLKLGLYTDNGTYTCSTCISTDINPTGKQPGSYNHEYIDAFTYAEFGADFLKDDNCNAAGENIQLAYGRMSDGLLKSGRGIAFCLCGGATSPGKGYQSWSPDLGNYWRCNPDIDSTFSSMLSHLNQNSTSAFAAGPGRWNDPDMLEIGNGEFTNNYTAAQTHFTMWCEMAAPLLAGINVGDISPQSLAILTNSEAIAVDQDSAGEQGIRVASGEVWSKPLGYDFTTRAVALLNRSTNNSATITCNFTNLGFQAGTTATVRDLWTHEDLGTFTGSYTATIPPYGSKLLKIVGTPVAPPGLGITYLSSLRPIYAYTGSGTIAPNKSIGGNPITLGGVTYPKGIGVNSRSGVEYNLGGVCSRFQTTIGVDSEVGTNGTVIFQVFADGTRIYESGVLTGSSTPETLDLDVTGVRRLTLGVDDDNDGTSNDHADWANALVIVTNTTPQVPETPSGLVASPGNSITLNWNNTLAAITYNVKRSPQSGGPYTNIANVPITTFTDSNVVSGATYYYVVSAVSSLGEGSNSLEIITAPCDAPAAPTNVVVKVIDPSQLAVTWNASFGATSYNVYRFTPNTPPELISSNLTTTNFTDTLPAITNYYYLVTAANDCNQSGYSLYAPAPTTAPTWEAATPGNHEAGLEWNAVATANAYDIKRATTDGGPYVIIAGNITSTSFLDTTLTNGVTYYYIVSAVNAGGEGPDSAQISVTPVPAVTAYWTNTVTTMAQNWNNDANWTNTDTFPNLVSDSVIINSSLAAAQTINLNQAITLGALEIGDANGLAGFTLAANGGSLAFNNVSVATLTQQVPSAGDTLATPISLLTDLIVINNTINPLTIAGPLTSSNGAALTIGSGVLQIGNGTTDGSLGAVNVVNNTALVFNCNGNETSSGIISGTGSLTNNGAGTVTLNAVETYTGVTVVNAGILALGAGNFSNSGLYTSSGIIINNSGTVQVNVDNALMGSGQNSVPITINTGGTLTGLGDYDSGGGTDTGTSSHIRGVLNLNGGTLTDGGSQNIPAWGTWDLDGGVVVNGGTNTSIIACLDVVPTQSGGTIFNVTSGGAPSGIDLLVSGNLIHGASASDTGIVKNGNGNMTLTKINSYTGNTTVNGGTLALTGSGNINSSAQIAINNATFDISGLAYAACSNSQFSMSNSKLALAIPSTATTNETTTTLNLNGITNVINVVSLPLISNYPQRFHLIKYTTLNGTFNMGLGILSSTNGSGTFKGYITNAAGFVDLVVTSNTAPSAMPLVWTGVDPIHTDYWDVGISENWKSNNVVAIYTQGNPVTFNDTSTSQTNVKLMAILTPGDLTVSNSAVPYNLGAGGQGEGRISGTAALTKSGTNVLILDETNSSGSYNDFSGGLIINAGTVQIGNGDQNGAPGLGAIIDNSALVFDRSDNVTNANVISGSGSIAQIGAGILTLSASSSFTGNILVQNGTLQINNNSALGPTNGGAVTITNGGTLDLCGPSYANLGLLLGLKRFYVSGWGVHSNGAIINSSSTWQYADKSFLLVTMQGDTAIGGPGHATPGAGNTAGRWDLRGTATVPAVLSTGGQPYNLFKVGSNQVVLVNAIVDTNLANIDVQKGFLEVQGTTTLGNANSNLIVEAGATFGMYQAASNPNKHFILNGDGRNYSVFCEGSANSIAGPILLNSGGCLFTCANGKNLTLLNSISGPGSLLISNASGTTTVYLAGANNSYTGNTIVIAGTLALSGNSSIPASPFITVSNGATLNASGRNDVTLTLTNGQTLTGNGLLNGNVVIGNGAILSPGGALTTMTFSNNLTLNRGSTTIFKVHKSPTTNDMAKVVGVVTYGGTLIVSNISTTTFAAGDSFKLFNAADYNGTFTNIVPAIPAVNLAWNTNNLINGILSVISSPTLPPVFSKVKVSGSNFIFNGTNGISNWPYYVLASTNISLPLTNWMIVSTNLFDVQGRFNFTNPQNPMIPQMLYMLKLQ